MLVNISVGLVALILISMSLKRKILAVVLPLLPLCEWSGHARHDEHTHREDSRPTISVEIAAQEVAPPAAPFVPDDDGQMYGAFLLRQQDLPQREHRTPYPYDVMASEY
jgi:hypothetical protein